MPFFLQPAQLLIDLLLSLSKILDRLAKLDTNTISDALDFLNLPGATYGIRPLWNCPKIVGRASTIQLGPKQGNAPTVHLISPVIASINSSDQRWHRGDLLLG